MWISLDSLFEQQSLRQKATGGSTTGSKAFRVPAQLAHCMVAVSKKGKDATGAWNICRASLTKHGYLKAPYQEKGKLKDVQTTSKGITRGSTHAKESGHGEKTKEFRKLFRDIETRL